MFVDLQPTNPYDTSARELHGDDPAIPGRMTLSHCRSVTEDDFRYPVFGTGCTVPLLARIAPNPTRGPGRT